MQDFREIVKKAIGSRSVYSIAKAAGVPEPALRKWLGRHQRSISSEFLERLFAALGVRVK